METFSALLAICAGNSSVTGEFPTQRPVTRSFDVSFDLRLNKRLSKQSWGWWFETPSHPLSRHCNDISFYVITGMRVSNMTFNGLVMRYADQSGKIEFNDYIHCAVRMKTMFGEW